MKELLKKPTKTSELIFKIKLQKTVIEYHLRWLIKKKIVSYKIKGNIRYYFVENERKAQEFIENPSKFIKCAKINNHGTSQLKAIQMLSKKVLRYSEIEKYFKFSKASTFKLISSLRRKGFIKKVDKKGWSTTNKGGEILQLNKQKARYLLYSNTKEI